MPSRAAGWGDPMAKSHLKRKRSNPEEDAVDAEEDVIKDIPSTTPHTNRWFLVVGYPHIGINVKMQQTYSEDSLRDRCSMDKKLLAKLEKALANPNLFLEVDEPQEKDPTPGLSTSHKRRQPPSREVSQTPPETASTATPAPGSRRGAKSRKLTNAELPSTVGVKMANDGVETKAAHDPSTEKGMRNGREGKGKGKGRGRKTIMETKGKQYSDQQDEDTRDLLHSSAAPANQPTKRWFVLKGYPNLGMGLRINKKYSEEQLIGRCTGDEVMEKKLRAALSNPAFFEETEAVTEETVTEESKQNGEFEVGDIVWFVRSSNKCPWPGLVASTRGKQYALCPFVGQGNPDSAEDGSQVGPEELVHVRQVHPWQGDVQNLVEAMFLAKECQKKARASPKQVVRRKRLALRNYTSLQFRKRLYSKTFVH